MKHYDFKAYDSKQNKNIKQNSVEKPSPLEMQVLLNWHAAHHHTRSSS